ncbi:MAG: CoA transferase subunit A [Treponema sp.]|nr:CoA transferase subunit A [Treponema sp.]
MAKIATIAEAAALVKDGMTVMVGGFMGCGSPHTLLSELVKTGVKDLTLICNDAGNPNGHDGSDFYGIAKLIHGHQVKKLIASHIGLNPEAQQFMNEKSMEVVLVPQGSLVEMIRAGGAGLGGILTPTGVATMVETDCEFTLETKEINGKKYLLMAPLHADIALINGYRIDKAGNVWYKGSTRNFNIAMATAADLVIAEAENIVDVGAIEPENVVTAGVFVDYIVQGVR